MSPIALPMLLLLLAAGPALAQQVWRCGADGRSFSDRPCTGGTPLQALEPRPLHELQAAQERAAREVERADRAHRERTALEAAQRGNGLAAFETPVNRDRGQRLRSGKGASGALVLQPPAQAPRPDADGRIGPSADRASRRRRG